MLLLEQVLAFGKLKLFLSMKLFVLKKFDWSLLDNFSLVDLFFLGLIKNVLYRKCTIKYLLPYVTDRTKLKLSMQWLLKFWTWTQYQMSLSLKFPHFPITYGDSSQVRIKK